MKSTSNTSILKKKLRYRKQLQKANKLSKKIKREERKKLLIKYGRILEATNLLNTSTYLLCGILLKINHLDGIKLISFIPEGKKLNLEILRDDSYKVLSYSQKLERAYKLINKAYIFEYLNLLEIDINVITGYLLSSSNLTEYELRLLHEDGYVYLKEVNYKI